MATKTVYVELVAETKKLNQGLKKADKAIGKSTQLMKRLGVAIAGVFAFSKLKGLVTDTINWGKELDKVRREMGVTVHEAQQLFFFADATGVAMANLRDAAFEVRKRFGEIDQNERFREMVGMIDLTAKKAAGLNNIQLMFEALRGISELDLEKQEIALDQIFGGGAAKELNQLVKDEQLLSSVLEKAGGVRPISADFGSFQELQATTSLVKANFQSVSAELIAKILPAVTRMLEWILKNEEGIRAWIVGLQKALKFFTPIGYALEKAADLVGWIYNKWTEIVQVIDNSVLSLKQAWEWAKKIFDAIPSPGKLFDALKKAAFTPRNEMATNAQSNVGSPLGLMSKSLRPNFEGGLAPNVTQNFIINGGTANQAAGFGGRQFAAAARSNLRGE